MMSLQANMGPSKDPKLSGHLSVGWTSPPYPIRKERTVVHPYCLYASPPRLHAVACFKRKISGGDAFLDAAKL